MYNSSVPEWQSIGPIQGAQGATGPNGPIGPRGDLASVVINTQIQERTDVNNYALRAVQTMGYYSPITLHRIWRILFGAGTTGNLRGSLAGGIIVPESGIYMVTTNLYFFTDTIARASRIKTFILQLMMVFQV